MHNTSLIVNGPPCPNFLYPQKSYYWDNLSEEGEGEGERKRQREKETERERETLLTISILISSEAVREKRGRKEIVKGCWRELNRELNTRKVTDFFSSSRNQ